MKNFIKIIVIFAFFMACSPQEPQKEIAAKVVEAAPATELSDAAKKVRDYMKKEMVIAHRGSTYWTPEETEPAFRWARNIGADYLEFDLQMTKDSILIALHDSDLSRTSNVADFFPDRTKSPAIGFTLKELRSLDAGSWFNKANPERARKAYMGLKILTFKDVVMIAEGYRIKKVKGVPVKEMHGNQWSGNYEYELDPADNGNRPGIYAETKKPNLERLLSIELAGLGWDINSHPKQILTTAGKVGIGNTKARFVLQSFKRESILKLENYLPGIPKCLLLWHPKMEDDLEGKYADAIQFCIDNNVQGMGSSIAGGPNSYGELTAPWMADMIHKAGMHIHPYTFDTVEQLTEYKDRVEGVFTNRADLALAFYGRESKKSPKEILKNLGY